MNYSQFPIILDVTIRDGGYLNNWQFSAEHRNKVFEIASIIGVDFVEVGYIDHRAGLPVSASWMPEELERIQYLRDHMKIAVMCRPSVENREEVISQRKDLIDLIRIPVDLRYPELANALADVCINQDIPYSFNLTNVSCFTLDQLASSFAELAGDAAVVYLADSRGALVPEQIVPILETLQEVRSVHFGFHAHNNLGLAKENTLEALNWGVKWIDGSILGIGLGGRNLDIKDAFDLAYEKNQEKKKIHSNLQISEHELGISPPGSEKELFKLTGLKNFKMEWAVMMQKQLGQQKTMELIKVLPDEVLFQPEDLKPYLNEKYWNQLVW